MKWNVFYHNSNKRQIEPFNIFNHCGFRREFCNIVQKHADKDLFAEELWHCLMYYFWSKCEYEVLIYPWPCSTERDKPRKMDIFSQIICNWAAFVDYAWEHRREIKPDIVGDVS